MLKTVDLKAFHPLEAKGLQRIGNTNDGGYVVHLPSLKDVDCLINYGVGYNVSFEKEFNKVTGKPVYAFDPTMKKIKFFAQKIKDKKYTETLKQSVKLLLWLLQEKNLKKHQINFIEEGLSATDNGPFKTLGYHLSKYQLQNKKIFLKIDIEGGEYEVLNQYSFYENLDNAVQIAMEFHYLKEHMEQLSRFIQNLSKTHSLIHIHGNNNGSTFMLNGREIPEVIEVAFLHNAYLPEKMLSASDYPVSGLDFPCNRHKEDIKLDFFK